MSDGTLTELEGTKMQLFALRNQILQQQIQSNLLERAAFIEQIELAHPGYKWNESIGKLEAVTNGAAPPPTNAAQQKGKRQPRIQ